MGLENHLWLFFMYCSGGGGSVGEKVKEAMSANIFKQVTWLTLLLEQKTKLELLSGIFPLESLLDCPLDCSLETRPFPGFVQWKVHWYCPLDSLSGQTCHWTVTRQSPENYTNFHSWKLIFSLMKIDIFQTRVQCSDSPAESGRTMWGSVKTSIFQ